MNYAPQSEQTKIKLAEKRDAFREESLAVGRPLLNKSIIEGFLTDRDKVRFTASGTPVVRFKLLHLGQRQQKRQASGHAQRDVVCPISVICVGKQLCAVVSELSDDALVKVEGFLTRNAYKDELSWVVLEASSIELVQTQDIKI